MQFLKHAAEAIATTLSPHHPAEQGSKEDAPHLESLSPSKQQHPASIATSIEAQQPHTTAQRQLETLAGKMGGFRLEDNNAVTARALVLGYGRVNKGVFGHVVLYQEKLNGPTLITGRIQGLKPGAHGVSIHEYGDITDGMLSTGAHWNPHKTPHGALDDAADSRHLGDLGNIVAYDDGVSEFVLSAAAGYVPLLGKDSCLSRSIVVHEKVDDLGRLEVLQPTAESRCTKKANEKQCGRECGGSCVNCCACNSYINGNTGTEIALGTIALANKPYIEKQLKLNLTDMMANISHYQHGEVKSGEMKQSIIKHQFESGAGEEKPCCKEAATKLGEEKIEAILSKEEKYHGDPHSKHMTEPIPTQQQTRGTPHHDQAAKPK